LASAVAGIVLMAAPFESFLFTPMAGWSRWPVAATGLFLTVP